MMVLGILLYALLLFLPLLVGAIVLVCLGLWGKPKWSAPYCAKCKYDLRGRVPEDTEACPECGATLTGRKAVAFIRYGRRWGLVVLGIVTLLWPFLLIGGAYGVQYYMVTSRATLRVSSGNMTQQTTPVLIAYVQTTPDEPWAWDELEQRLQTGKLSQGEVDQIVDGYITHMQTASPNGVDQSLHWTRDFFQSARQADMIDDARMLRFMDAYYGPIPRLDAPLDRARPGERVRYAVMAGGHWDPFHDEGDVVLLSHLNGIAIDGQAVEIRSRHGHDNRHTGSINVPESMEPGEYEAEFEMELAYVDATDLVGFDRDKATPADWPPALRRWTAKAKGPVTVLGPDDRPVRPTSDAKLAPSPGQDIRVVHCVARPEAGKVKIVLRLEVIGAPTPLSFDVVMQIDGVEHETGFMRYRERPGGGSSYGGMEQELTLDALAVDIRALDVVLRPNPEHLYHDSQVTECWGEEVVLANVPIRRLDVTVQTP